MLTLLLTTALALAGKWDGAETDVIVERVIPAPAEALYTPLTDLQALARVFPTDCVNDWTHGTRTAGVGALTRVTYRMGPMRRRLTATLTKAEPGRYVELDHMGRKGFVTQVRLEELAAGGTKVTLGTWIEAPPWPFKGVYFKKVRPAWLACYERTLDNLAATAGSP